MYEITLDNIRTVIREEMQKHLQISMKKEQLLSRKEAAKLLGVKENTLAVWATNGTGPAYTKIGSYVRYRRYPDIEKFINDNTVSR